MDTSTKAKLVEEGGKLAGDLIRVAFNRPVKKKATPAATEYPLQTEALKKLGEHTVVTLQDNGDAFVNAQGKLYMVTTAGNVFEQTKTPEEAAKIVADNLFKQASRPVATSVLPTSEETTVELKRRLRRELYKAELDLVGGLRIAGKPCDCLEEKHTDELHAVAEELISQDPGNQVYQDIIQWIRDNQHKVTVAAIESGQYKAEYPYMASQFKDFRKRVMGTVGSTGREKTDYVISLEQAKELAAKQAAEEVEKQWHSAEKK